uniref:filamin-A-interacting protein 1-like isoform X1 n=2 Tax=Styela clava TaxID=7725 RepID=UPI00193A9D4F|nr:filamin-A-interacting protein 1-like isoform X1 [Styela clava]
MVENKYNVQLDFVSPSIYQAHRHPVDGTGTVKKNRHRSNVTGRQPPGNGRSGTLNGVRQEVMTSALNSNMPPSTSVPEPNINLSREELLKLLSVFEGELQARDEVIEILKSERPNNPAIQERYGLSNMPLQALQRDAASLDATTNDHVAEQTKENLQKIIQHQKDSYKKLKQALLAAEQANQRLAVEITDEKKKHQDYMIKSDDFVNLLEEERERLKIALDKEKEISENREIEASRKLKSNKDELAKLKSLSLVLVEERQHQVSELAEHKKQITDLERRLKESEIKCKESETDINAEREHAIQLENDLETQSNKFFESQEDINAKLEEEKQKNLQLEEKVNALTVQLKKLKTVQRNLQKTDDQLWRIHEKLEKDEEHELLLEEVELLRQRVKDMEEGEMIYTQAQEDCKDIRIKLEEEVTLTRSLRSQLKTLQAQVKVQKDLQRSIEDTDFRFDELQLKFDFEKRKSNDMKQHLQKMKARMTDLDQYESIMQESEEKMKKMKEKIILLQGDKKCVDDQVKFLIEKNLQFKNEGKADKEKVTEITEKFINESKKVLKLREELGQEKMKFSSQFVLIQDKLKEAEEKLKQMSSKKQSQAEEANDRLRRQVIMLKTRLDELEIENEEKEKKITLLREAPAPKQKKAVHDTSFDLVDMVHKLHETEERCEELTKQLLIKSKACEDLKKDLSKFKQTNNNCNLKGISVTAVCTQTEDRTSSDKKQEIENQKSVAPTQDTVKSNSLRRAQTTAKLPTAKVFVGSDISQSKPAFSITKMNSRPPISPVSSLTRSSKVAPVNFRVTKKPPPSQLKAEIPPTPVENKSLQDVSSIKSEHSKNTTTMKAKKDVDTGAPVKTTANENIASIAEPTSKPTNAAKYKQVQTKSKSSIPSSPKIIRSRNLSKTRESGKQVTPKDSMSPTRIPKFRSSQTFQNLSEPSKFKGTSVNYRKNGQPK